MKPTQLKLKPELELPQLKLPILLEYPLLQKRVNNPQYELSGIHNLIVELKKQTIEQLKQQFINNNNNVNLHQFMWLISNSIMLKNNRFREKSIQDQYYQYEVEYEIVKVFQEIDIDNSNSICWEEYIQYITSSSLMEINQDMEKQLAALTLQDKKTKQIEFSHKEKVLFRKNPIRKILEIQKLNLLAIIQKKSDILTFLTINGGIPSKPYTLQGIDQSKVLSIDYSQDERMFGVLMNTHVVVFVEDGDMPKVQVDNKFLGNQVEIMYLRRHKLWLLVSLDNTIQIFSSEKSRKKSGENYSSSVLALKPHAQQLIGIRQLLNPLSIVSASWSGSIKIWSLTLNQLLIDLNPVKQDDFSECKSIKGFEVFNHKFISYIICWMFSTEISVWLPSSSLTKPYMGKLKGHVGIVQQAKFLSKFPTVISIDNKNSVRVWDITKMQCIQSWKMQSTFHAKIHILRSVPYILFYDKLIEFFKSTKQANLIEFTKQKRSTSAAIPQNKYNDKQIIIKAARAHESNLTLNSIKKTTTTSQEPPNQPPKFNSNKEPQQQNSSNNQSDFDFSTNSLKLQQKNNTFLSILYDDYFGCFIILTSQAISIIGVNTGNLINRVYIENKNDCYVAICMKQNRRFFVANNLGEIACFKTEDCSILYKIYPYKDIGNYSKQLQPQRLTNSEHKVIRSAEYNIYAIDYNIYNKILLVISQSDRNLLISTYDNFSSFEPTKKKQVLVNQINVCCFASAQKYGVFYIGSNDPEVVSIWDYHNIIVLRSVELPNSIISMSVELERYNLLIIGESLGVRVFRVLPIDARNNTRASDSNLIVNQLYIKTMKRAQKAEIMFNNKQQAQKIIQKKNKVSFQQVNKQEPAILKQNKIAIEAYVLFGSTAASMTLTQYLQDMPLANQPLHSQKPNITKQLKKISLSPQKCPTPYIVIDSSNVVKSHINGVKKNVEFLGKISNLIYFQTKQRVLNFYKPEQFRIWGKLSMPKCQVIEWRIFYDLASKILARLIKAEKVSKEIYAFKHQRNTQSKNQYLRCVFFLNKYFVAEEMDELRQYFASVVAAEANKRNMKVSVKKQSQMMLISAKKNQEFQNKPTHFDKKYQERVYNRNQTAEKMKIIQKKYSQVFSYIKNRQQNSKQKQVYQSKPRSASLSKLSTPPPKRNQIPSSPSIFKIKTTVSSANKMYFEHTKEIKNYLHKIGIINSKTNELKL